MFAPTKVWRKWHKKINQNQRRYAVASALAASAVPALVMARGHAIDQVVEVPLVLNADSEKCDKTKAAVALLKSVGAYDDVEKAAASKKGRWSSTTRTPASRAASATCRASSSARSTASTCSRSRPAATWAAS